MKACLEAKGWTVSITADGGISVKYAPDGASAEELATARERFASDQQACLVATGYDVIPSQSPEEVYQEMVTQDDCLRAQGYAVTTPTFEQFQNGQLDDRSSLPPGGSDAWKALQEVCHF